MMRTTKPQGIDPEGLYNITQAAEALGVCRHTVVRYAKQGIIKMKVRKAGLRKVISGAEIMRCWEKTYG